MQKQIKYLKKINRLFLFFLVNYMYLQFIPREKYSTYVKLHCFKLNSSIKLWFIKFSNLN